MKKKSRLKANGWIATVPMAIVAVLFVVFIFLPGVKSYRSKRDELTQRREFITQSSSLLLTLDQARRDLDAVLAHNAKWQERLPDQEKLAELYRDIHSKCESAGVTVTRFEPSASDSYEHFRQLSLDLSTESSFHQAMHLLGHLESTDAPVWIENIEFDRSSETGAFAGCNLKMTIFADPHDKSN